MRPLIKKGQWLYRPINLVPSSPTAKGKGDLTFQRKTEWNLGTRLSPHVRESKVVLGRDPFNQNFRKFRSKTQWIGLVQPEKFRKNGSTFWGRPLFPVGPVGILVERIAPHGDCAIQVLYSVRIHFSVDWLRFGIPILSGIWIISFGLYSRFQSSGFQIPQAKIHGTNLFYRYILLSVI